MDRKELIEQKKKQLYFKNSIKSMNAVTIIEIYETGVEREFYKKIFLLTMKYGEKARLSHTVN